MVVLARFLVLFAFITAVAAVREAKDEEFPFQVSVQTKERRHLCGGAIIAPRWVVTASSCLKNQLSVQVAYGSAHSDSPNFISSHRIEYEDDFNLYKKSRFALIELDRAITFSNSVKQAKLPTSKAEYRNTTKLSGWKVGQGMDVSAKLYVSDVYYLIPKNCKTASGAPVNLDIDEFCGIEEDFRNDLYNPGTIVSKSAVVLGLLPETPMNPSLPNIFVKLSEQEQWIKDVLKSDAQYIHWVDEVPRDSARSLSGMSLILMVMSSVLLLRFY